MVDDEDEPDCIHGLPLDIPCTICSGKDNSSIIKNESELDISLVVAAQYDGQCRDCNLGIHPGQMIVHTTTRGWVHASCA